MEIDDLLLLTLSIQTQLSVTCECLYVEIKKKQLERTVIKGAAEATTGHSKEKNKLCVEKMSHFSSQNVNKRIAT